MLIEAQGVVETITPGGYTDHRDAGRAVAYDVVSMAVTTDPSRTKLRVVLDGRPDDVNWQPGMNVRFRIEDHLVGDRIPVFSGSLQDVRVVGGVA